MDAKNLKVSCKNAVNMDKQTSDTCRKDYEKMGLAASQARFLCLTARKANCEYKSTALAQEKLNITEQMSQIANDYAQAMNATKLVWAPDGMAGSFGVSYGLLMTPSAANDYNPYMVTTPSGAIILNTAYKEAAEAAGITKMGGLSSGSDYQDARDRFIAALVAQGIVTDPTAKSITVKDYDATLNDDNSVSLVDAAEPLQESVTYADRAGMGNPPLIKGGADAMTFADLILSDSMGKVKVDWAQLFVTDAKSTELEVKTEKARLSSLISAVSSGKTNKNVVYQIQRDYSAYKLKSVEDGSYLTQEYADKCAEYENLISYASTLGDENGPKKADNVTVPYSDAQQALLAQLKADLEAYEKSIENVGYVNFESGINIKANDLDYNDNDSKTFSIIKNGVIDFYEKGLENMTLGDILSQEIVLMSNNDITKWKTDENGKTVPDGTEKMTEQKFIDYATRMLDHFASILGYSPKADLSGQGLNVDEASSRALKFAYAMISNIYLNEAQIEDIGSRKSDKSLTENSAYVNATTYNRIGKVENGDKTYYAVSLSGMMRAFLTYYENALSGANSNYNVGISRDTSTLVTDDSGYVYLSNELNDDMEMREKDADFFDQLFNNLIEYGWRYDSSIDDNEYLEAVLKNGRYSMSSLNEDGYYYQTRYNETGYMEEVSDTDAIARAEAEFAAKKAELTYKEDTIDMKTKKLDAEIASITAEVDSVKNIITKSIEKTFTMFST